MQISVLRPGELGPAEITAWHSLQQRSELLANPFLCPEFTVAVGIFRADARVAVLTDGGDIAGFFPFQRRRFGVGVPIGAGLNDCQGLIHAPGAEWDPRELLRACGLAVWQFDHLVAGQRPFERHASATEPQPIIDLSAGFTAYEESVRARLPAFCRAHRRHLRKITRELGEPRFVLDSRARDELRTLMSWKSAQYRRTGWVDAFDRPWIAGLIDHLFGLRTGQFAGLLSAVYAGEQLIAAHFGIRSSSVLANWFPAYDPRFARYSPGTVQHWLLYQHAPELGITQVNCGGGASLQKSQFKSRDLAISRGMVASGRLTGCAHRLRSGAYQWARHQVRKHPFLFQRTNRVLRRSGRLA